MKLIAEWILSPPFRVVAVLLADRWLRVAACYTLMILSVVIQVPNAPWESRLSSLLSMFCGVIIGLMFAAPFVRKEPAE
jgi:hypothetical protein